MDPADNTRTENDSVIQFATARARPEVVRLERGTFAPVDGAEPWGAAARGIEWADATWSPAMGVRQ